MAKEGMKRGRAAGGGGRVDGVGSGDEVPVKREVKKGSERRGSADGWEDGMRKSGSGDGEDLVRRFGRRDSGDDGIRRTGSGNGGSGGREDFAKRFTRRNSGSGDEAPRRATKRDTRDTDNETLRKSRSGDNETLRKSRSGGRNLNSDRGDESKSNSSVYASALESSASGGSSSASATHTRALRTSNDDDLAKKSSGTASGSTDSIGDAASTHFTRRLSGVSKFSDEAIAKSTESITRRSRDSIDARSKPRPTPHTTFITDLPITLPTQPTKSTDDIDSDTDHSTDKLDRPKHPRQRRFTAPTPDSLTQTRPHRIVPWVLDDTDTDTDTLVRKKSWDGGRPPPPRAVESAVDADSSESLDSMKSVRIPIAATPPRSPALNRPSRGRYGARRATKIREAKRADMDDGGEGGEGGQAVDEGV
ncbi:hypothetical protein HK104_007423, partial [Borealophlyctis nickersoniae]